MSKFSLRQASRKYLEPSLIALNPSLWLSWWKAWETLPVAPWLKGAHYFRKGNFQRAAEFYHRGLLSRRTHRARACAQLDYAYCLYRLGNIDEARQELYSLTINEKRLRQAFFLLAEIETYAGHKRKAMRTMRRCVEFHPGDSKALAVYAHCLLAAHGPREEARKVFAQLRSLHESMELDDPKASLVEAALAAFEIQFGDAEIGDRRLSRVLAVEGYPLEALLLRARRSLDQGRILQARRQLDTAMRRAPRDPRPVAMLAESYLSHHSSREPRWALQLANSACGLGFWENVNCLQVLADAYEAIGDQTSALLIVRKVRALAELSYLSFDALRSVEEQVQRLQELCDETGDRDQV